MKINKIGSFVTDGNLLVTDPCYDLVSRSNHQMKVKPGNYNVIVATGKVKDGLFGWDSAPNTFRVCQLQIVHEDYVIKDLKFKDKKGACVSVDSGQAGFFNINKFKQDLDYDYVQYGKRLDFFKSEISSNYLRIKRYLSDMETKKGAFERLLPLYTERHGKEAEAELIKYMEHEITMAKDDSERMSEILATGKFPAYFQLKKTRNFYEMVCDLTSGEFHAGVESTYGAASRSGYGDGGADLKVAREGGDIVAAYLEYISPEEFVNE